MFDYSHCLPVKKNMWDGTAFLEICGERRPVRVTEMDVRGGFGEPATTQYVCLDQTLAVNVMKALHTSEFIKKVIYNAPTATIVYWNDGTKTVVHCSPEDTYSPEIGLYIAIIKRFMGNNTGSFNKELRKWLPVQTPATSEEVSE